MHCELIDYMGDDVRVANAARVSFNKETDWEFNQLVYDRQGEHEIKLLGEKDIKLLNYLAKHNHWTPFSHVMITMRETVPIFVARQRFKHMVGFTYNEVSRRYVDDTPTFYIPDVWRSAPESNRKQGSGDGVVEEIEAENVTMPIKGLYEYYLEQVTNLYNDMLKANVAPEQARMVLPQSMYTSYYVTGSLAAWARAYKLRIDPHAQLEIQQLAQQWGEIIGSIPELKHSWGALTESV